MFPGRPVGAALSELSRQSRPCRFGGRTEQELLFFRGSEQGQGLRRGQSRSRVKEGKLFGPVRPLGEDEGIADLFRTFRAEKFAVAGDEVPGAFEYDPHFGEVFKSQSRIFSGGDDFIRPFGADAGHAEQLFDACAVDFHRKILQIPERPGAFGIVFGRKIAVFGENSQAEKS